MTPNSVCLLVVLALSVPQAHVGHAYRVPGQARPVNAVPAGSPGRTATTMLATTATSGEGHEAATTAASTSQAFTSTVVTPQPRLLYTETTLTLSPTPEAGEPTDTDQGPSVIPTDSEVISVKSGHVFTTEAPTTVSSPPASTQAGSLFELTPRAANEPTTTGLCWVLTLRCQREFRIRLCRLYEECLLIGTPPTDCFRALTSVIASDERCNRS
ncbi:uncharacterized protein LOC144173217 [Haemaphysalis longicornis]